MSNGIIIKPMKILLYNRLNTEPVQRQFDKTIHYLQQGDFRSADVRKMKTQGFYRARLDDTNRLLFKIGEYEGVKYLFILEVILNHDYAKSRFLRGAVVQEEKLTPLYDPEAIPSEDSLKFSYLNPNSQRFTILDKIITLNKEQSEIIQHEPPLLLLGAAGSGKTMLALEKIKQVKGRILYVTLSPYLASKAEKIFANDIKDQKVDFYSLDEYVREIMEPDGDEVSFGDFKVWFERIRHTVRLKDVSKLFEEIRGVLTGTADDKPYLSKEEYEQLGVRQSVFVGGEKEQVYAIFRRYLEWLKADGLYDPNIAAQAAQAKVEATYDLVVVDEVQDMTNVQLSLLLKSLKRPDQFILCGDANQVVHPNFFSWTSVKRLLHRHSLNRDIIRLLPSNHRNDEKIIKLSNRLLALKNVRFGSVDKESILLTDMQSSLESEKKSVRFYEPTEEVLTQIDKTSSISPQMVIIVLREEDKAAAKKHFKTPLIFTVHEAKGLEFNFVVLFNLVSSSSAEFTEICEGVSPRDLKGTLEYRRPKHKEDRSLQAYLFYINSFYVAITRAINYVYIVEQNHKHRLFSLLNVKNFNKRLGATAVPGASFKEWQMMALELEKFGKKEQADAIKAKFSNIVAPPWSPTTFSQYMEMRERMMADIVDTSVKRFNIREKAKIYDHCLFYHDMLGFTSVRSSYHGRPKNLFAEIQAFALKMMAPYRIDSPQRIEPLIKKYGPNFQNEIGLTPLMLAVMAGATKVVKYLLLAGANPMATDNWGRTAFQLAIVYAHGNEQYASEKFAELVEIVHPPYLMIRHPGDTFSLPYGTMDFFISSIILALQKELLFIRFNKEHVAFQVEDFCKVLRHLPATALSANMRKKEYVKAFLEKREIRREDSSFIVRMRPGYYTIWLEFEIPICREWVSLKQLFDMDNMDIFEAQSGVIAFGNDWLQWQADFKAHVENKLEMEMLREDEEVLAKLPDDDLRDWPV